MGSCDVQHGTDNAGQSWGSKHTPLPGPSLRTAYNPQSSPEQRAACGFRCPAEGAGETDLSPPFPPADRCPLRAGAEASSPRKPRAPMSLLRDMNKSRTNSTTEMAEVSEGFSDHHKPSPAFLIGSVLLFPDAARQDGSVDNVCVQRACPPRYKFLLGPRKLGR